MELTQSSSVNKMKFGLNGAVLKWIAVITMFIDHFGAVVFAMWTSGLSRDGSEAFAHADLIYQIMRGIGRTAFPIFCFLLVEGFFHTKHLARYIVWFFLFCVVSEIPFDLAIFNRLYDFRVQNVYWTLLLGLLAMAVIESVNKLIHEIGENNKESLWCCPIVRVIIRVGTVIAFMAIAGLMKTDYDFKGVALILIFYFFYHEKSTKLIVGYLSMIWEYWCFPAFILMYFYNGKRGKQMKYFFYLFYPCHLLLLYFLRVYLLK